MATTPKPEKVQRGPALASEDPELDRAGEATPDDVSAARETARRHGRGTILSALLGAEESE